MIISNKAPRILARAISVLAVFVFALFPLLSGPAEMLFQHRAIEEGGGLRLQLKAAGDLNGDGRPELLATSEAGQGILSYEYPNGSRRVIAASGHFPGDLRVADVDADGDLDVVAVEAVSAELRWYENPGSEAARAGWPMHRIGTATGRTPSWTEHVIHTGRFGPVMFAPADLNADGRPDLLLAPSEAVRGSLVWFEAPADPRSGDVDVAVAEGPQTTGKRLLVHLNGGNGLGWSRQTVTAAGLESLVAVDLESDGDRDLAGAAGAAVQLWENQRLVSDPSALVTTAANLSAVPTTGLSLWLKADAGVITTATGAVSQWQDQSGNSRHASQSTAGSQPARVSNAVNGQAALRFDGTNDFLTFNMATNGLTGVTIVMVSSSSADLNGGSTGASNAALFWNETSQWGAMHLSPFQKMVRYRFGTGQVNNLPLYPRPSSLVNTFSRTMVIKNGTTETLFVDGAQVLTQSGKLAALKGIKTTGNLGRGYNDDTFFPGQIAEVLVYSRTLTDSERQSVESYLKEKYFAAPSPNRAPAAQNQSVVTAEDSPLSIVLTGSDPDGDPLTFSVTAPPAHGTLSGAAPNLTYAPAANFNGSDSFTFQVSDGKGGTATGTVSISVTAVNDPPVAVLTATPASGAAPLAVSFNASASSDLDGTIASYTWNFGDGSTGSGSTTSHTYSQPGAFTATLTVTDNGGATGTAIALITATAAPIPTQNLALWLRADAGVTLNGSTVSQWADQSGSNTHATQPVASSQPQLVAAAANGRPALRFDGANDFLGFNLPVNGLAGMTMVLVSANSSDRTGGGSKAETAALFWNESASWGAVYLSPFQNRVQFRFGTTQASNWPTYTRPGSIGNSFSISVARKDSYADTLHVNGALVLSEGGKLAAVNGVRNTGDIGRGYNDNSYFPGDIAEVLIYTRALTDAERQAVEQYLAAKYFPPDITAPVITAVSAATGSTAATVNWTTNEPADGQVEYGTTPCPCSTASALVTTPSISHAILLTGLAPSTTYHFRVRSRDAAGNLAVGSDQTFTTTAAPLGISVYPGDSLLSLVDANPEGTAFVLKPGIHRMQPVTPRNGNTFTGEPGAVLSGARLLTSFSQSGPYWAASGQTQQGFASGQCDAAAPRCSFPEDLFLDDQPLKHVGALIQVGPGSWYFDYAADTIYMGDNPAGRNVETSVSPHAFRGAASNVTIRSLVIEKYAAPAQHGAVMAAAGVGDSDALGNGWIVENCEIRWNHGGGVRLGHGLQLLGSNIHDNGQIGIVGRGDNVLVEGNTIAYNNFAGFSWGWEGGGTKFVRTQNLTVRNNYSHHNFGPGLWTDIDNIYTVYESNRVEDNQGPGIFHEISYNAVVRNNIVKRNGKSYDAWLWGAQILVSTSKNVEVHDNTVEVDAAFGDGIALLQQNRGTGKYGVWETTGNWVHHNTVTYRGNVGQSGAAADYNAPVLLNGTNRFDFNTFHAPSLTGSRWEWQGMVDWNGFRAKGQEANGTADTNLP